MLREFLLSSDSEESRNVLGEESKEREVSPAFWRAERGQGTGVGPVS